MTGRLVDPQPTSWQANARDFATTSPMAIEMERRLASRRVVTLLVAGDRGRAHYELTRSVLRQARMAGLGDVLQVPCPCGGRCTTL